MCSLSIKPLSVDKVSERCPSQVWCVFQIPGEECLAHVLRVSHRFQCWKHVWHKSLKILDVFKIQNILVRKYKSCWRNKCSVWKVIVIEIMLWNYTQQQTWNSYFELLFISLIMEIKLPFISLCLLNSIHSIHYSYNP